MKKAVTFSLFVFWMIAAAVLAAGLVTYEKSRNDGNVEGVAPISELGVSGSKAPGSSGSTRKLVLSAGELAKHNSGQSCWLLIADKIYDVTNFINLHPGNAQTILASCGQDATAAYETKDGRGKPHSNTANAMLADYFIGNLGQSVNLQNASNGTTSTNSDLLPAPKPKIIPPSSVEDDD